jgi:hypothetical protein
VPNFAVDTEGNITTPGRFQGRSLDEVMNYLDGLEAAVTNPDKPPPAPPNKEPAKEPTAAERLAASAANRIDPLQAMTLQRLEQDDEAAFAATVTDYEVYREKINKLKESIAPQYRAQKNLHRTLYINVKSQDESIRRRIYDPVEKKVEDPPAGEEAPPSPGAPPAAAVDPPPARSGPKAAPPMASPTPGNRPPPKVDEKARKPKLIATDKVRSLCRQLNQDVDKYLIRLEDQGMSQSDLDTAGQLGKREEGRKSVYDRTRAPRT